MKTECKRSRPAEITSEFPVPLGRLRSIDRPALCTVFARAGTAGRLYDGSNTNDPSESDKTDGVRLPGQKAHLLTNGHHRPLIFVRCYRNPNPCICLVTTARDSGARGGSRRCPSKSPPRPRTRRAPCPTGSAFRVTSRSSCSSHSNCVDRPDRPHAARAGPTLRSVGSTGRTTDPSSISRSTQGSDRLTRATAGPTKPRAGPIAGSSRSANVGDTLRRRPLLGGPRASRRRQSECSRADEYGHPAGSRAGNARRGRDGRQTSHSGRTSITTPITRITSPLTSFSQRPSDSCNRRRESVTTTAISSKVSSNM